MATTYLEMTQGTPTSTRKCTYSGWLKKAENTPSVSQSFLSIGLASDAHYNDFRFETDDAIRINIESGSGYTIKTNRLFRDPAAWYHVVVAIDTEQSVAADRVKTYINGVQETSFSEAVYPAEDYDIPTLVSGDKFSIGRRIRTGTMYFNGEMSWVQFVDGLQLAPTEFGSVDATSGIWKIKPGAYATPGTNGFCLAMEDRSNLDLDTSSNAHTFTTTGDLTATYDNPSNNFPTLNDLIRQSFMQMTSITQGNTTMTTGSGAAWGSMNSTMAVDTSKWYFEAKCVTNVSGAIIGAANISNSGFDGSAAYYLGQDSTDQGYQNNGNASNGGASFGNTYTSGDIIGVAMDLTNSKIYFSKNGTWENSGDPSSGATGTGAMSLTAGTMYSPTASGYQSTVWSFNYGNGYFGTTAVTSANADDAGIGAMEYDVPAGYYCLCTKNIKAYGG